MPRWIGPLAAALALAAATATHAQNSDGKPAAAGPPDWSAFKLHIDRAKAAAGTLWASEQAYFCLPGQRADRPDDPPIEPVQLFDNVWAIGQAYTVVYVIKTSAGPVLIDAGWPERTQNLILPALRSIGVDPASVTYVLATQPYQDHWGGAKWFHDHGAHVALGAGDWDIMAKLNARTLAIEPKRDVEARDLVPILIGGQAFTPVVTPGPFTPGSVGWFFPVSDGGRTRMAAVFGASILRADRLSPGAVRLHADGVRRWGQMAAKAGIEVELANHPMFDDMAARIVRLNARLPGAQNPFVVGKDGYRRFVTVMDECLRATIARKGGDVG